MENTAIECCHCEAYFFVIPDGFLADLGSNSNKIIKYPIFVHKYWIPDQLQKVVWDDSKKQGEIIYGGVRVYK